jgi:hypothetical protein
MVKQSFNDFWNSQKSIIEDVYFGKSSHAHTYIFEGLGFVGEHCEGMRVTGEYDCRTGGMTFHFYQKGIGAVRRFCLGNNGHPGVGRYHEHILQKDSDALAPSNLPYAISRDDFKGLDPFVAWNKICTEGSIFHTGVFNDPREWCK